MSNPNPIVNVGNAGNKSHRPWVRALNRLVIQKPELLNKLARKTFAMALRGNMEAIKEIGNRLDGKAIQASELTVHGGSEMFKAMTRDQIMQAIRDRLTQDREVAERLGLALPALEAKTTVLTD